MSRVGSVCGWLAPALMLAGVGLVWSGAVRPVDGFGLFALAIHVSLVGLVTSCVGLIRGRGAGQRPAGAVRGLGLSAATLTVVVLAALPGMGRPPINDISTDTDDPPAFAHAVGLEANIGADLDYPGEAFASQQHEAYPAVTPLLSELAPEEALERARAALAGFPCTEITHTDPTAGNLEATAASRMFRFVDDVVVRVRPEGSGSRVDVRSRSRDGRGDLGVNAARIEALLEAIR